MDTTKKTTRADDGNDAGARESLIVPREEAVDQVVPVYRLRCRRCGSCYLELGARLACLVCGRALPLRF